MSAIGAARALLKRWQARLLDGAGSAEGLQLILRNVGWLYLEKLVRLGLGLVVFALVARHLGPDAFGILSYATALVMLFGVAARLGLERVVVRRLAEHPAEAPAVLGTATVLRMCGALAALALANAAVLLLQPEDALSRQLVALLAAALLFNSSEVIGWWFESRVQARYTVWARNTAFLIFAAVKLGLVWLGEDVTAFAWASLGEAALAAAALWFVYRRRAQRFGAWVWRPMVARDMLREAWPLLVSSIAMMVYARTDQVMLGQWLGDQSVGLYAAAVRVAEAWYFVAVALILSAFPAIVRSRESAPAVYRLRLTRLYEVLLIVTLSAALAITLGAELIVAVAFGEAYAAAAPVLALYTWVGVAALLGGASTQHLVAEQLGRFELYRAGLGAALNLGLNVLLIPRYGMLGAAAASLIAFFCATFSLLAFRATRPHGMLMLRALTLPSLTRRGGASA